MSTVISRMSRFAKTLAMLAGLGVVAGSLAVATPASALGSNRVSLQLLDSVTPTGAARISGVVVDSTTHRGYVLDRTNKAIQVYDVSGEKLVRIASISMGVSNPFTLALDEVQHQLAIGDSTQPTVALIDVDPNSPTVNSVIKSVDTGSVIPQFLSIDDGTLYAGGYTGDSMSIVDIGTGSIKTVTVGFGEKLPIADPITHDVYVALPASSSVATLDATGDISLEALPAKPLSIAVSDGGILVGTSTRIERYDPSTWARTAVSATLPLGSRAIRVDESTGIVYSLSTAVTDTTITALKAESLAPDGTIEIGSLVSDLAVDQLGRRTIALTDTATVQLYSSEPTVQRRAGADRFEVSAEISRSQFAPSIPVVYIASGAVYSDSLSASAAAGVGGGAVLLVRKDEIPSSIRSELTRLTPQRIVVIGGSATIDPSVEIELRAFSPKVSRITGADRYVVSAAISAATFAPGVPVAFIASGEVFPDALSGSAAAGKSGGPVLLIQNGQIPESVRTELSRLSPAKIVVLGGPKTVANSVVDELTAKVPNTTRVSGADRFEVSAAVSASSFAVGLRTVFVASGEVFPDALSGSAAAIANGSPVLLISRDSIPATVAAELDHLNPGRIIVLGGAATISESTLEQMKRYIN
ncbi:cell wall-binding repeat-containing protein [Herbiconiux liangxiaofengii]|uniref:cell wall-binding repeat-containing protein n=1 Tax=Herbiconiux liangxiaofengii TaxID=3342795 RepID=UPI0035B6D129